ncbi:hypothetical protein EGY25_04290 [Brevundimonas intermedia]|uniref:Uncharacterized protein n=1 Tax=Brevundimonas intermedia TaxID=74315 RepID=A0A4Y9S4H4_9CAUL|nr:tetratricopeptide repeat protein [Brevundimonas intermedia]TFW14418.1 hypothetical protein EGY25_04290 [Brevundimonas intermedia]
MDHIGGYRGESHLVIPRPGSKKLIVIFSGTGKQGARFDFWNVSQQLRCNVLLVNDAKNGWYQDGVRSLGARIDHTAGDIEVWAERLGCDRIHMTGSSMGAYGAILFGSMLNADVLAFGADTRLKLTHSRSEKMMPDSVQVRVPDLRPVIAKSKARIQCLVGEADPLDMIGAAHISSLPQVRVTALRGVDHFGPRHIQRVSDLAGLLNAFVNDKPLPKIRFQNAFGPGAKRIYLTHDAFMRKDWPEVERLARLTHQVAPHSEPAHYYLGRAAMAQGDLDRALAHLGLAVAMTPHYMEAHLHLINALCMADAPERAITVGEAFVEAWPKQARGHAYLSNAYRLGGFKTAAIRSIQDAIAIQTKPEWEKRLKSLQDADSGQDIRNV